MTDSSANGNAAAADSPAAAGDVDSAVADIDTVAGDTDSAVADTDSAAADGGVETVKYRLAGVVQGVGFRHYVKKNAEQLGLSGWVRNEVDGSLTVLLRGEKTDTDKMYSALMQGPPGASVASMVEVQTEESDPPQTPAFQIR